MKAQPPVNELLKQIKNELKFTDAEAHAFLAHVTDKVRRLQIFINILSSPENSLESKKVVVDFLLTEVFTKDASVTVSSKNSNGGVEQLSIKDYLDRLVNQGTNENNGKAQIYFNPRYLKISDFEKNSTSSSYQMLIQIEQYSQLGNAGTGNEQVTRKTIRGQVKEMKGGKFQLKWQSIQVDETLMVSEKELNEIVVEFEEFKERYTNR